MSLSDNYHVLPPDHSGPRCKTCVWYEDLSTEDQEFFDSKLGNGTARKLWRACRNFGLEASETSFRNHLREHVTTEASR